MQMKDTPVPAHDNGCERVILTGTIGLLLAVIVTPRAQYALGMRFLDQVTPEARGFHVVKRRWFVERGIGQITLHRIQGHGYENLSADC